MSSGAGGGSGGGATGDSFASARAAMTSDAAYSAPSAPARGGGDGDGGNQVTDPGFVRALDQQARIQTDPSLGDPDPEVDVPTKERQDTITSFAKNLKEISSILESEVKDGDILVTQGAGNVVDISNSLKALYK